MSATQLMDPGSGQIRASLVPGGVSNLTATLTAGNSAGGLNITNVGLLGPVAHGDFGFISTAAVSNMGPINLSKLGMGLDPTPNPINTIQSGSIGVGVAPPVAANSIQTAGGIIAGTGLAVAAGNITVAAGDIQITGGSLGVNVAPPATDGDVQVGHSLGIGVAPPAGAGGLQISGSAIIGNGVDISNGGLEIFNPAAVNPNAPNNVSFGVDAAGDLNIRNTAVNPATSSFFVAAATGNVVTTGTLQTGGSIGIGQAPPAGANSLAMSGGLGVGVAAPVAGAIQSQGQIIAGNGVLCNNGAISAANGAVTASTNLGAPFVTLSNPGTANNACILMSAGSALNEAAELEVWPVAPDTPLVSGAYFRIRINGVNYAVPCYGPLP